MFTEGFYRVINEKLNNRYDVFHAYLVKDAEYAGEFELPKVHTSALLPKELLPFSKAVSKSNRKFEPHVMFYEHDREFERLWHNPRQYLERLRRFPGVISPDFSLYRNMPLAMQLWNTYRGRALATWLQGEGIPVIPNVRWGDERTYAFAFDGIEEGKPVSVGTYGCIQHREDRAYFKKGLCELVRLALAPCHSRLRDDAGRHLRALPGAGNSDTAL